MAQSDNSERVMQKAPAPFNKETADVILRSSDNVDFHVRKSILAEASPFFEAMFTLPQLPENRKRKERDETNYEDDVPTVDMSEGSWTLYHLLRFCYPLKNPDLKTLKTAVTVLDAARKLDMPYAISEAREQFLSLAAEQPLQAYIFATCHRWEDEMREAARLTLCKSIDWDGYIPEMEDLSAGDWSRLQLYNKGCRKAVSGILDTECRTPLKWLSTIEWPWFTCECAVNIPGPTTSFSTLDRRVSVRDWTASKQHLRAPSWWMSYLEKANEEIRLKPHRDTILYTTFSEHFVALSECKRCRASLPGYMKKFQEVVANQIDRKVSQVELEIKL